MRYSLNIFSSLFTVINPHKISGCSPLDFEEWQSSLCRLRNESTQGGYASIQSLNIFDELQLSKVQQGRYFFQVSFNSSILSILNFHDI